MEDWTDDRLELALRASNEGIWDWDLGSDEITYSGRILRFLNYRRHEVPHLFRTPDLIHPDDREEFEGVPYAPEPYTPELEAMATGGAGSRAAVSRSSSWSHFGVPSIC